ncbi:Hypothetical predicted protein [Lecanosticta acicola]|uniref:Uncharacterized protein n=1 Tax=Lecanosticta acicola TaxID=111012 RepID=A0AAI8YRN8_9PEZI|nr:Hypothetical predicted protein [Lecanosticta acicola]
MESFEERMRRRTEEQGGSKSTRADGRNLLGYDSPVNSTAKHSWGTYGNGGRPRFPNAIQDWTGSARTLRERSMLALMADITDKPEWTRKVFDEGIVEKWRKEAAEHAKTQVPERTVSQKMFEFCIAELRDYAKAQEASNFVPALDADAAVYKSDAIITDDIKQSLRTAAAPLEDVPEALKDWHPDSDGKVLDLVHPSLFPLLYGRSRILPEGTVSLDDSDTYIGKGEVVPVPNPQDLEVKSFPGQAASRFSHGNKKPHFYSDRFQWLPCEVALTDAGVKITSYINNLPPKEHKSLYEAIETIIARVISMWDATLASTERTNVLRPNPRIDVEEAEYIEPQGERVREPDESEMDEDEIEELNDEWHRQNRVLIMPEPGPYSARPPYQHPVLGEGDRYRREPDPLEKFGLRKLFAEQGLQIIVKLANIHLTPEKPTYDGGSWHVEGQLNEHICASALYYYDSSNTTDSYLSFREGMSSDAFGYTTYQQDDYNHLERLYEIQQHQSAIQYLGRVKTTENRLLTFPNVFQHRVEPFKLADPSRPGHRKILALFLVDPYNRIPSTANVPPQQKHWWRQMVTALDRVGELPPELAERVVDSIGDFPIDLDEAKKIRLELMEERKIFVDNVEARLQDETFNFCEH